MVSLRPVAFLVVTACSTGATMPVQTALRVTSDESSCRVDDGARPLLSYRYAGTGFKPYIERLFTPGGVQVLRDAPPDHTHHHALMLAFGVHGEVDFWGEVHAKVVGRQVGGPIRRRIAAGTDGRARSVLEQTVEWIDSRDATLVLREERGIEVSEHRSNTATLITWRSRLVVPPSQGKVRLWGRPYFGLGMRFVAAMDRTGRFVTSRGVVGGTGGLGRVISGDERLLRSEWCAYVVECDGLAVTVAMFDHPDNPRHPATWFTMRKPFAYLSATLGLQAEPMQIEMARPMQLTYGVALWDGSVAVDSIERAYQQWRTLHRSEHRSESRTGH